MEELYYKGGKTIIELCEICGCKSDITMSKILRRYGIDTDSNKRRAENARNGMTEEQFKEYLTEQYGNKKRSINSIAEEFSVSHAIIRKYLGKYKIPVRTKNDQMKIRSAELHKVGTRKITSSGYVAVYMPDHPRAGIKRTVYEHTLVMERILGRYLEKGEVVHHIDLNKSNNSPDNLMLLTNEEHARLHGQIRTQKKKVI